MAGLLAGRRRARVANEAVKGLEERSEGLATPRWRVDERVIATRDGHPALGLGLGRCLKARRKPLAHGRAERGERIRGGERGHGTCQYRSVPPNRPDVLRRAPVKPACAASTSPRVNYTGSPHQRQPCGLADHGFGTWRLVAPLSGALVGGEPTFSDVGAVRTASSPNRGLQAHAASGSCLGQSPANGRAV
jgi:hypothetical protein